MWAICWWLEENHGKQSSGPASTWRTVRGRRSPPRKLSCLYSGSDRERGERQVIRHVIIVWRGMSGCQLAGTVIWSPPSCNQTNQTHLTLPWSPHHPDEEEARLTTSFVFLCLHCVISAHLIHSPRQPSLTLGLNLTMKEFDESQTLLLSQPSSGYKFSKKFQL